MLKTVSLLFLLTLPVLGSTTCYLSEDDRGGNLLALKRTEFKLSSESSSFSLDIVEDICTGYKYDIHIDFSLTPEQGIACSGYLDDTDVTCDPHQLSQAFGRFALTCQ